MSRPRKLQDESGTTPEESPPEKTPATTAKTRPIRKFQVDEVSAAVWTRTNVKTGAVYYSVSLQRHYVNAKGESKYTDFFNPSDLSKVISLCRQSDEFILEEQLQDAAGRPERKQSAQ